MLPFRASLKFVRIKQLTWLLLALTTAGCGFHLRGMVDMPKWLDNIAIIVQQGHRYLEPLLKDELQTYTLHVNPNAESASYWLIIEHDEFQHQITSVSSSTTPRQYLLTYIVTFKLQRRSGKDIIPPTRVVVTRQVTINGNRILGSNDEEDLLKGEMRRDAVIQILNRLSRSVPSNKPVI